MVLLQSHSLLASRMCPSKAPKVAMQLSMPLCTQTTRRLLFQRVRASIGKQLLTVRPQFRKALHEVRGHVDAMEHAPMLALGPPMGGGAWQLVDFRELQADVRERQFQRQLLQASTSIQQVHDMQAASKLCS